MGLAVGLALALPARGQNQGLVVRDGSLGTGPLAVEAGIDDQGQHADYLIPASLGEQVGGNLFHSFERFSIGSGETATFTGQGTPDPGEIRHVISRVTGGDLSSIDGTLRSTLPNADLWLMNPAGIVFGSDASLDVPGSFHASTAERLVFDTGEDFEARAGGALPVLEVADPTEFGFLGAGSIAVEGAELGVGAAEVIELAAGGELLLAGGGGIDSGGTARLSGATLVVAGNGFVHLRAPDAVIELRGRDVTVDGDLAVTAGAGGVARIDIDASDSLSIGDGALVTADLEALRPDGGPSVDGGAITLTSGGQIEISGVVSVDSVDGTAGRVEASAGHSLSIAGLVSADAREGSFDPLSAGAIQLAAPVVEIGGTVSAIGFGAPRSGEIAATAQDLTLQPGALVVVGGRSNDFGGDEKNGSVLLEADRRIVLDGVIETGTDLRSGDIRIASPDVSIGGRISSAFGEGDSGQIDIVGGRSGRIFVARDAVVASETEFNSGKISLDAGEIVIAGRILGGDRLEDAAVELSARRIVIERSGEIGARGDFDHGGEVVLVASELIRMDGSIGAGEEAGTVTFDAPRIHVRGVMRAEGLGASLRLEANELLLLGATLSTRGSGSGAGDVELTARSIAVIQSSNISTDAGGDGGNITIDAENLVLDGSTLTATSSDASGGNISITTGALIEGAENVLDASGVTGGSVVVSAGPELDIAGAVAALEDSTFDASDRLVPPCSARGRSGTSGTFVSGRQNVRAGPEGPLAAWPVGVISERGEVAAEPARLAGSCR